MLSADRTGCWRVRWPLIGLLCSALLAGCATTPRTTLPLDAVQQADHLAQLRGFSFAGRVAVAPQGLNSSVDWQQRESLAKVKLSGPLGAGTLQLEHSPDSLRLTTVRGEKLADAEAQQLVMQELGFLPPFDALRYWTLGVPAPGEPAIETTGEDGLLQRMEQQGWVISIERRVAVATRAGVLRLPARLTATHGEQRLRLAIDRWRLK